MVHSNSGKSVTAAADLSAECIGYEPWSGRKRPTYTAIPYPVALILPNYTDHARKFLEQDIYSLWPRDQIRVEKTADGAPRAIWLPRALRPIRIFTSKQDIGSGEAGNYQRVHIDEPCSRDHYIAITRGLRSTRGKVTITMTPISEPWMTEDIMERCGNLGGDKKHYVCFQADWRENLVEYGGHVRQIDMENFWEKCDADELEARKFGRPIELTGRVFREFDSDVHVIDEDPVPPDVVESCPKILSIDPHPRRPFAMCWAYVTPTDEIVIYDEWPPGDYHRMKTSIFNYDHYAEVIEERGWCLWNLMDPNSGRSPAGTSGLTVSRELSMRTSRAFLTDANNDLTVGHTAIKGRLAYDTSQPVSFTNRPSLFIKSNCRNVVRAFRSYVWDEWDGHTQDSRGPKPKPQERHKDFLDVVRYICVYPSIRYLKFDGTAGDARLSRPRFRPGWQNAGGF